MDTGTAERASGRHFVKALAGLQAGTLGGFISLGWIFLASLFSGESLWLFPNISASTFYGSRSLTEDFGLHTCAGVALHLLVSGSSGILFALIVPVAWPFRRSLLAALLYMAALQLFADTILWRRFNPWMLTYIPPAVVWIACIILAIALGTIPWLVRSMQRDFLLK